MASNGDVRRILDLKKKIKKIKEDNPLLMTKTTENRLKRFKKQLSRARKSCDFTSENQPVQPSGGYRRYKYFEIDKNYFRFFGDNFKTVKRRGKLF